MVGSPCPGVSFCSGLTREEGVTGHSFGGVPTNLLLSPILEMATIIPWVPWLLLLN